MSPYNTDYTSVSQPPYVSFLQGKVGVSVVRRRAANNESSFLSYLEDLRSRCDTLPQTPVKRLKVREKTERNSAKKKSQFKTDEAP